MSLEVRETKWKKKASNKRIGVSSIESVNTLSVDNIDSELGNKELSGYASKRPKQGRRM